MFRIGDGEQVSFDSAPYVYRSYKDDLGIELTQEEFNKQVKDYKMYYESNQLKSISFTPETVIEQDMSDYYFLHLDVKIPRK